MPLPFGAPLAECGMCTVAAQLTGSLVSIGRSLDRINPRLSETRALASCYARTLPPAFLFLSSTISKSNRPPPPARGRRWPYSSQCDKSDPVYRLSCRTVKHLPAFFAIASAHAQGECRNRCVHCVPCGTRSSNGAAICATERSLSSIFFAFFAPGPKPDERRMMQRLTADATARFPCQRACTRKVRPLHANIAMAYVLPDTPGKRCTAAKEIRGSRAARSRGSGRPRPAR